jgi:hypothetical protein
MRASTAQAFRTLPTAARGTFRGDEGQLPSGAKMLAFVSAAAVAAALPARTAPSMSNVCSSTPPNMSMIRRVRGVPPRGPASPDATPAPRKPAAAPVEDDVEPEDVEDVDAAAAEDDSSE